MSLPLTINLLSYSLSVPPQVRMQQVCGSTHGWLPSVSHTHNRHVCAHPAMIGRGSFLILHLETRERQDK